MIKEIINKETSLKDLLDKNDFEFINSLENNINEIHEKILEQKIKRKHVMDLAKMLNTQTSTDTISNNNSENVLDNSKEIVNIINSNITSLYSIEVELNNICQSITSSYISNSFKDDSDSIFDSIKTNITEYSNTLANFNSTFEENDKKIDNYLNQNVSFTLNNVNEKISINTEMYVDNPYLVVSEKDKKVYLPYNVSEINSYLEMYPNSYSSFEDVVEKEFIYSLDFYTKNPIYTRFRESYALIRDREGKSVLEALRYSFDLMFKNDLNPCIIAACKNQAQLDDYLKCLENNNLDNFKHFKIQFYVNPL